MNGTHSWLTIILYVLLFCVVSGCNLAAADNPAPPAASSESEEEEPDTESKAVPPVEKKEKTPEFVDTDLTRPQFFSDGPFSVVFPTVPDRKSKHLASLARAIVMYTHLEDDGLFSVMYLQADGRFNNNNRRLIDDPERLFDIFEFEKAELLNGKSLKDGPIKFAGYPGRIYELVGTTDGGSPIVERRIMILVRDKWFSIGCGGTPAWVSQPAVAEFFGSFQVGGPPDPKAVIKPFRWITPSRVRVIPKKAPVTKKGARPTRR